MLFASAVRSRSLLVLSLEKIDFVNSSGLGALVSAVKDVRLSNGGWHCVTCRPMWTEIFTIIGLKRVFDTYATEEEAVASFAVRVEPARPVQHSRSDPLTERECAMSLRPRLLIVDDELLIRDLLYDFFKNQDYDIAVAENGQRALAQLETGHFDTVIIDLKMPDMDGSGTGIAHPRK